MERKNKSISTKRVKSIIVETRLSCDVKEVLNTIVRRQGVSKSFSMRILNEFDESLANNR